MESRLSGVFTALVTPFTADGFVDEDAMSMLVERQIEAGVAGVVACGTTGEASALSESEHQRVVEVVVQTANGAVPVIAGAGTNQLNHSLELTHRCIDAGADYLLHVTPYYIKPTQHGLRDYFWKLAEASSVPIILYNVPGRTGVALAPSTILELTEHRRIVALKQAVADLDPLNDILYSRPANFSVLSGEDALTAAMIAMGVDGVISVASNVCPREMVLLVDAALAGDREQTMYWQSRLQRLMRAHFVEPNPIPVKFALASLGLIENNLREPLTPLSPRWEKEVREAAAFMAKPHASFAQRMTG
jgi:4-hydroxy-tetrahydrodipicolinate synthase